MTEQPPAPDKPKTSFARRLLGRLAISAVTVFITLFVIELVVRAVPLYPDSFEVYNPDRGWVLEPNKSGTYLSVACLSEFRSQVTINSHGLHDVEHEYEPAPDTYRILIVGDSTVASFEVPLEQTFYRVLENQLNETGDRQYEIIGGGHRGYGTDLEVVYYEQEARQYQADLVLLMFQPGNDVQDNHIALRLNDQLYFPYFTLDENGELVFHHPRDFAPPGEPGPPYLNPIHNTLLRISRLYRLAYDRLDIIQGVGATFTEGGDPEAAERAWEEAWDVTRALVERLRADVEQDGAQFAVAIAPGRFRVPQEGAAIHTRLNAMLDDMDIPHLDLLETFNAQDTPEQPLHFTCDPHWTAVGHRVAAEALAAYVPELEMQIEQ
jgi:hypothetical protein